MFSQVPVYLGDFDGQIIGTAEIFDNKLMTITIRSNELIGSVQQLAELNEIRGLSLGLQYIHTVMKENNDAPA